MRVRFLRRPKRVPMILISPQLMRQVRKWADRQADRVTRLMGKDALRFLEQIEEPANPAAAASVARGVEMARQLAATGKVVVMLDGEG